MSDFEPRVVCFSCRFGWGYLSQNGTLEKQLTNWIPIICSGKIDVTFIVSAFEHGADGVLILGCPEGDCHYQDGNLEARKRVYLLRKVLEACGIEQERVRIEMSTDPSGTNIPKLIEHMKISLKPLGPLKVIRPELSNTTLNR